MASKKNQENSFKAVACKTDTRSSYFLHHFKQGLNLWAALKRDHAFQDN